MVSAKKHVPIVKKRTSNIYLPIYPALRSVALSLARSLE